VDTVFRCPGEKSRKTESKEPVKSDSYWSIDKGAFGVAELWWSDGPLDPNMWFIVSEDLQIEAIGFGDKAEAAFAGLV